MIMVTNAILFIPLPFRFVMNAETYHMIDTCDPTVACWSDDGETFVVKNTDVFEKQIIPQFFKHSKFSSFVRQLNFYGFRKIKYTDTIRIDPKLEAETANFWRFHHEKFRRGRPDLLIEIKRHGGKESVDKGGSPSGSSPPSNLPPQRVEEVVVVKSEVTALKERIAAMSKSMERLSTMVQQITVNEADSRQRGRQGAKRVKVKVEHEEEENAEMCDASIGISSDMSYTPSALFPSPVPSTPPPTQPSNRQNSVKLEEPEDDFADLFTVLEEDNLECLADDVVINGIDPELMTASVSPSPSIQKFNKEEFRRKENRPDPKLMDELGDALCVLPKDVQVMLVRRLISTISSTDSLKCNVAAASTLSRASIVESDEEQHLATRKPITTVLSPPSSPSTSILQSPLLTSQFDSSEGASSHPLPSTRLARVEVALPLAAATLGALLAQYGASACGGGATKGSNGFLPVIPVHV